MDKETKIMIEKKFGDNKEKIGIKEACINASIERIQERFGVGVDKEKFRSAVSGSGNELLKMDSKTSSSLLAFLFFQNAPKNKLTINGTTYNDVKFEYKNEVFNSPSNVDVVLENDDSIIFIECKFTEYLTPSIVAISDQYLDNDLFKELKKKKTDFVSLENVDKEKNKYSAAINGTRIYAEGIKQIIAHLIGIKNYKNKEENKNKKIAFLEVVYGFDTDILYNYRKAIDSLKDTVYIQDLKIDYLGLMTYQEILNKNTNYVLAKGIKEFYKF